MAVYYSAIIQYYSKRMTNKIRQLRGEEILFFQLYEYLWKQNSKDGFTQN